MRLTQTGRTDEQTKIMSLPEVSYDSEEREHCQSFSSTKNRQKLNTGWDVRKSKSTISYLFL